MQYGFLLPGLFVAAAAAGSALLIYAYLRRGKEKRVPVASLIFLKLLEGAPAVRRKFFPPWRFFLELLLLFLLAAACAGFYMKSASGRVAILIDNSAGMLAVAPADTKPLFSYAQDQAKREILNGDWGSEFAIFATSPELELINQGAAGSSRAEEIIDGMKARPFRDNLGAAIEKIFAEHQFEKLVVITDRPASEDNVTAPPNVSWHNIRSQLGRTELSNLAVGAVRIQEPGVGQKARAVEVSLQNFGPARVKANVILSGCGSFAECEAPVKFLEGAVEVPPRGAASLNFSPVIDALAYKIELRSEDALYEDNIAWITSESVQTKGLIVSPLPARELGLDLIPNLALTYITPDKYTSSAGELSEFRTILFHRFVPDMLPDANIIFVMPPDNRIFAVGSAVRNLSVARWKQGHALLSYLNLSTLNFNLLTPLKLPPAAEEIIATSGGTAGFAGELNNRRFAAFGFELLPYEGKRHPLLSILTLNTFKWTSEITGEIGFQRFDSPISLSGDIARVVTAGGAALYSGGPQGSTDRLYVETPGLVRIERAGGEFELQAFRFYSPDESDLNKNEEFALTLPEEEGVSISELDHTLAGSLAGAAMLILLIDLLIRILKLYLRREGYAR